MIRQRTWAVSAGLFALVLAALAASMPANGQALYGSIVGTVVDSTGATVPGATVKVVHAETNQTRQTVTNEVGAYSVPSVPTGTYSVTISKEGFRSYAQTGVNVTVSSVVRVDASLEVGAIAESVQVSAQAVALQTDKAEVRSEVTTKTLEEMPVPVNRNYQNLFILVPGFTPPSNAHSVSANPTRGLNFNVNGGTRNANTIRIEGASATNVWLPHVTAYVPGLEAIETVSVTTSSLDADQGLAGAAAVNVQMKSGTNDVHGSLFEYHTNNKLKAKPFFLPAGERNPKNIDNQLGGTIGGPIRKDKLFYFIAYDGQFQRQTANNASITVPTAAIRAGDMSGSSGLIYDPATGAADGSGKLPLADKRVPASRIEPIALKILEYIPQPTWPDRTTNNFYANGSLAINRSKIDGKLSWNATDKLRISGRTGLLKYSMTSPAAFGEIGPNISSFAGRDGHGSGTVINSSFAGSYIFNPSLMIDSYFSYTRLNTANEPFPLDQNVGLDVLGIPGTNGPTRSYGGWPQFNVSSYTRFGAGSYPIYYTLPTWEYVANFNKVHGGHNFRWGIDISRQKMSTFELASSGSFSFNGGSSAIKGQSTNQYNSFGDFLMGYVSSGSHDMISEGGRDRATSQTWAYSFYFRDQWQIFRKLTASIGMRWDYFPMGVRKEIGFQQYDFADNKVKVCGLGSIPRDCGIQVPKKDFSPRIGFAYRATDTLVVRAGYGINFDPQPLSFARNLLSVYPTILGIGLPAPPNSNTAAGLLKDGLPVIPVPENMSSGIIDIPATVGIYTPPDKFTMGYIQSWNLTLQKRLFWGLVGQAGYVGTRQIKILQAVDQNVQRVGGGRASQPLYQKFGRTAYTSVFTNFGKNWYDSLQATLTRSFANGIQINAAYTWSKAMAICCDDLSDKNPAIQIPEYAGLNKALAGFDRTHVFSMAVVGELPFGRGKPWASDGIGSKIVGGWQVNSLFSAYTGNPFSVSASGSSLNASGNSQRADQVKAHVEMLGGTGPGQSWFDPLAFAPVTTARFGTAGFNILRRPGLVNLDLGLVRDFSLGERIEIQARGEALNFTNTPHFGGPGTNVSNMQLNSDGTIRNLGGYTVISSTQGTGREGIDERVFRFGIRVRF